jgi:hypothetical protein
MQNPSWDLGEIEHFWYLDFHSTEYYHFGKEEGGLEVLR